LRAAGAKPERGITLCREGVRVVRAKLGSRCDPALDWRRGGERLRPANRARLQPGTGGQTAAVAFATAADVDTAVKAARGAGELTLTMQFAGHACQAAGNTAVR
jgi:hypothetical protein